jgi:hypothetical protein
VSTINTAVKLSALISSVGLTPPVVQSLHSCRTPPCVGVVWMWALVATQKKSKLSTPIRAMPRCHENWCCNCLTVASRVRPHT